MINNISVYNYPYSTKQILCNINSKGEFLDGK